MFYFTAWNNTKISSRSCKNHWNMFRGGGGTQFMLNHFSRCNDVLLDHSHEGFFFSPHICRNSQYTNQHWDKSSEDHATLRSIQSPSWAPAALVTPSEAGSHYNSRWTPLSSTHVKSIPKIKLHSGYGENSYTIHQFSIHHCSLRQL